MTHLVDALPAALPHDLPEMALTAPAQTAAQAIAGLAEDFDLLEDWTARYQYLIDLGRQLPALPDAWRTPEHLLQGCQSQVWFVVVPKGQALHLIAASDSAIVSGLIALLRNVYSGRTAAEIMATPADFLRDLGLEAHLSPTRRNGLAAMVTALREIAARRREAA